ncbi:MAG: hypothetical protein ABFE02_04075 [Sulfuricella sp.]
MKFPSSAAAGEFEALAVAAQVGQANKSICCSSFLVNITLFSVGKIQKRKWYLIPAGKPTAADLAANSRIVVANCYFFRRFHDLPQEQELKATPTNRRNEFLWP